MTNFKTYYNSNFREDINRFFSTIPDESRFHEDTQNKQTLSIQYERLTPAKGHLDFLDKERKEYFGVALFLTILTDMVCFANFKPYYERFKILTRYPKFIGNCPGGCNYHLHPRDIFFAMTKDLIPTEPHLLFREKFIAGIDTMKEETINFFSEHMQGIDGQEFWSRCEQELPYRTTITKD